MVSQGISSVTFSGKGMHLDYLTGACLCIHSSTAIGLVTCSTHKFRPSLEGCGNQGRTNIA